MRVSSQLLEEAGLEWAGSRASIAGSLEEFELCSEELSELSELSELQGLQELQWLDAESRPGSRQGKSLARDRRGGSRNNQGAR